MLLKKKNIRIWLRQKGSYKRALFLSKEILY